MDADYNGPAGIHSVSAFQDNYIWLIRQGSKVAVVDPGDAGPVLDALASRGLQLVAILLTHHHHDHVGGVNALLQHRRVPVYGPADETLPHRDVAVREGDSVEVPELDLVLSVLDVPGHTAGHIAYHGRFSGTPVLFCGDTLFATGCGRLFEGTPAQMYASLRKLAALPADTRVYCAHEYTLSNIRWALAVDPQNPELADWSRKATSLREAGRPTVPTFLSQELAVNPFLRTDHPDVIAAVCKHAGHSLEEEVAVFGALRAWKDDFR